MVSWGEKITELQGLIQSGEQAPFDVLRRKYLYQIHQHTGRDIILYAANWTQNRPIPSELLSIGHEDIEGFMEATSDCTGEKLDLILHSPGGSAEATEAIVRLLRAKYKEVRIFIPQGAMSAAAMLTCSANEIVMAAHSYIGPIDPQLILPSNLSLRTVSVQAILEEFKKIKQECAQDEKNIAVWIPILQQYGPALVEECHNVHGLAKELVATWLERYMFRLHDERTKISQKIAGELADHTYHKTHSRTIGRDKVREVGLNVVDLEADAILCDLIISLFHVTTITFGTTIAVKIIENHNGRAFIKQMAIQANPQTN